MLGGGSGQTQYGLNLQSNLPSNSNASVAGDKTLATIMPCGRRGIAPKAVKTECAF